jgi:hypothetical protein
MIKDGIKDNPTCDSLTPQLMQKDKEKNYNPSPRQSIETTQKTIHCANYQDSSTLHAFGFSYTLSYLLMKASDNHKTENS